MSKCRGRIPVTTKVDEKTRDLLDEDADKLGVYRAEVVRRILDEYRDSRGGNYHCPNCEKRLEFDLEQ